MLNQKETLKLLHDEKLKYDKIGFEIIGLFGSFARNEATQSSDIDVAYDVNDSFLEKYQGFLAVSKIAEIKKDMTQVMNTEVDLVSLSTLNERKRAQIVSELIYA